MAKSVKVAYVLWFFLGWLGVHQFYLRRDRHAFFLWATLGGVFGIGWLRDLFYIPQYVADVNESPDFMQQLNEDMRREKRPKIGICRWAASVLLSYMFSALVYTTLWNDSLNSRYLNTLAVVAHLMAAFGIFIVTNEGHHEVNFLWCALGSLVALPLTILYGWDSLFYSSIGSSLVVGYKVNWRRQPRTEGMCYRLTSLTFLGLIYLGLISASIYYNATVTTKEGETVPLREAVHNFFKSPAWKETKDTVHQFYQYFKHHGWRNLWQEIVDALDPQGEANAYKVLGVESSASQKEIKTAYKKLAMQWHPDKVKDPSLRQESEAKFMEIQQAYDTLSKLKQLRSKKNKDTSN